jgi:hypothetical protein
MEHFGQMFDGHWRGVPRQLSAQQHCLASVTHSQSLEWQPVCCALLFSICPMSLSLALQTGEVTYVTSKMWHGVLEELRLEQSLDLLQHSPAAVDCT